MSAGPSLCHGRRVYGQDYRYDCAWLHCPILYADDNCHWRLADDDPNPDDETPPEQARRRVDPLQAPGNMS